MTRTKEKEPMKIEEALKPKAPHPFEGKKAIVLLSGGVESTAALYWAIKTQPFKEIESITLFYGQAHKKDLVSASQISNATRTHGVFLDAPGLKALMKGSEKDSTLIPNLEQVLTSLAISRASITGAYAVISACQDPFREKEDLLGPPEDPEMILIRPFNGLSKAEIVKKARDLGVPFDKTWSCEEGGNLHCGKCPSCVERRETFETAEVLDPVKFEDPNAWAMIVNARETAERLRNRKK